MRILIGIDDTDNKESRGTGFNSRELAAAIEENGIGKVKGITRHQLFVHPDIPYTSQNSSACLDVTTNQYERIIAFSEKFMKEIGADGSDVGLCIAPWEKVTKEIIDWGNNAKSIVLKLSEAEAIAKQNNVFLVGLTGTKVGMIGALAAVGLRKGGDDGRFIWLNDVLKIRDIENEVQTVKTLKTKAGIDKVMSGGEIIDDPDARVFLGGWARPVLIEGSVVLLVDNELNNSNYEWKCSAKEFIKRISN